MSDFMRSTFVRACQNTLDFDEGMRTAINLWSERPPKTWPREIAYWIAAHIEANANTDEEE
jgi:hypothetical protein